MSKQVSTINMRVRRFAMQLQYSIIALVFTCVCSSRALAQDDHSHTPPAEQHDMTTEQRGKAGALIRIVQGIDRALPGCGGRQRRRGTPFNSGALQAPMQAQWVCTMSTQTW